VASRALWTLPASARLRVNRRRLLRVWDDMRTLLLACAGVVAVSVLPAGSAVAASGAVPAGAGRACQVTAYVSSYSDGTVTPVNTVTRKAGKPIVLPQTGQRHHAEVIAVTPNGKTAYVVNSSNDGEWITPINAATNKPGSPIPARDYEFERGQVIAITPDSKSVYILSAGVTLLNATTNKIVKTITFSREGPAVGLYMTADGKMLYALSTSTLTPVSTVTNTAGTGIAVPATFGAAVTPDGRTVYVSDWNRSTVVPIDAATGVAGTPIKPVGLQPDQIVITPNGSTAYVMAADSKSVTPINTKTNTAGKAIKVQATYGLAHALALTPNGKTLFVLGPGAVTLVNTVTNKASKPVKVSGPSDIAITPNGRTAWVKGAAELRVTAYSANEGAIRFYQRHGFSALDSTLALAL
jgi:DNA-binding beta-propeller fold protein YncE